MKVDKRDVVYVLHLCALHLLCVASFFIVLFFVGSFFVVSFFIASFFDLSKTLFCVRTAAVSVGEPLRCSQKSKKSSITGLLPWDPNLVDGPVVALNIGSALASDPSKTLFSFLSY